MKENQKDALRLMMGLGLVLAGVSHLTFARKSFRAQVPDCVPLSKDNTVLYSGIVEIALGLSLTFAPQKYQDKVGKVAAVFFTAVFPGNISQFVNRRSAFGLDTDAKRFVRLFFQPAMIYAVLKATEKKEDKKAIEM